jgi:hypothetical protein
LQSELSELDRQGKIKRRGKGATDNMGGQQLDQTTGLPRYFVLIQATFFRAEYGADLRGIVYGGIPRLIAEARTLFCPLQGKLLRQRKVK